MYEKLKGHGIVPVIKFNTIDEVLPLADALSAGGINIMEITYRSDVASRAIELVAKERPNILVGAGTVLDTEQLKAAQSAGAEFVVSPGFDRNVVEMGLKNDIIMLPGCVTPSEITAARNLGLSVVKFFPASIYGGLKAIKALSAVFGTIKFIPTGGVSQDNLATFLQEPQVFACGGTWMVTEKLLRSGDFETVTALSRAATDLYHEVRSK